MQLSARELDVLCQMAEGKNNEAIAASLCLSVGVVEKHTSRSSTSVWSRTSTVG